MRITLAAELRAPAQRNTNLTMLMYQEPAMMRPGYQPRKEMNLQTLTKAYCPPSDRSQLAEQRRADQMAANNRRTALNRADKVKKMFGDKKEITARQVMAFFDYKNVNRANEALRRLEVAGLVKRLRTEGGVLVWGKV